MNKQTGNKGMAAIFTAALVAALFVGGLGGYAAAKAEGTGAGPLQQAIALDQRNEQQRLAEQGRTSDTTIQRASRWDHEERTADTTTFQRASRWDHEER
jgi:hypothetical protein